MEHTFNNNNCLTSVNTTYNDSSITTNSFTYSSSFPHQLSYNNSNSFVYDGLYLKQIKNYMSQVIKQFNYRGTKISSIQEPLQNKTIIFDYDYRGRRTKKLNQTANELIEYYYDGNILIREKHSNYSLNFLYNESNELIGFEHISSNNSAKTTYFYLRNAFSDIVEILDVNGNSLVHYLYDAFGNTIEIIDNSSNSLATINPFRYRGYYYDGETQLYWVSSRYYSPELCRWISPDNIEYLDAQSINGLNFYCYCINNPIMYADPSGNFVISIGLLITGFIFGASVGAVSSIIIQGLTDGWQNINGFQVLLDLIIGGISGLLAFSGIGAGGSAFLNGGLGFAGSVGGDLIKYNGDLGQVNWIKAAVMAGLNLVLGLDPGVQNSKAIGKSLNSILSNNAGFKAINKTLINPKVTARGIQGAFNLYGKSLSQGIYSALGGIISKRMNDSFAVMLSTAVSISLFEIGVDYFNLL